MNVEKLYYQDAYIKEFEATVLECKKEDKGFEVVLDRTAFFPEAGGQASDIGAIDGVAVTDVQIKGEIVYHYCEKEIETGKKVLCKIDFDRRFSFMQNHSGEHIISGIAHSLYGAENVGFHLYHDFATVDFDIVLDETQLKTIETIANERVWQNLDIKCYFPDEAQLSATNYRSKKELDGAIRLVDIENTDICACCAPHVLKTGEIGLIKLLDFERMRSGIRIIMKCGSFALNDYRVKYSNIKEISAMLSAKQEEAAEAVKALNEKIVLQQQINSELKKRYINGIINGAQKENRVMFEENLDMKEVQLLADGLSKKLGVLSAVFSKNQEGYIFAMCSNSDELDAFFADFKQKLKVKGGGRNGMVQGTVFADADAIKLFF